jgi:dinuclear metal center YbgI/SA1388 family protein
MKLIEIIKNIETWAPKEIAWQKDNVGLQVGDSDKRVKNIILCLEVDDRVIDEAIKKNCNFIISHHPLLFSPIKKITPAHDFTSRIIQKLIKNDITLYSAHTNLDYTKDGVSFQLANKLELKNINFLVNLKSNRYKIIVFVPEKDCEIVADAMFNAGAGNIGEYSHCSFRSEGTGTFVGSAKTKPYVGRKGKFESVQEIKLEMLVDRWKLDSIIMAMKKVHPYEEPTFDIYPVDNLNAQYGIGSTGELDKEFEMKEFLSYISKKLNVKSFRYADGTSKTIKKVAVCGGSGSEYLKDAVSQKCDAFITADIKYHTFLEAESDILLIDAGHYETEIFSLSEIKKRILINPDRDKEIKVFTYSGSTNPVIFYNK